MSPRPSNTISGLNISLVFEGSKKSPFLRHEERIFRLLSANTARCKIDHNCCLLSSSKRKSPLPSKGIAKERGRNRYVQNSEEHSRDSQSPSGRSCLHHTRGIAVFQADDTAIRFLRQDRPNDGRGFPIAWCSRGPSREPEAAGPARDPAQRTSAVLRESEESELRHGNQDQHPSGTMAHQPSDSAHGGIFT